MAQPVLVAAGRQVPTILSAASAILADLVSFEARCSACDNSLQGREGPLLHRVLARALLATGVPQTQPRRFRMLARATARPLPVRKL